MGASKLEEAQGNKTMPSKIIDRGVKSLQAHGILIDRETWLKEAEISEKTQPPMIHTCRAIINAVAGIGIKEKDQKQTWLIDAEECLKKSSIESARSLYKHALSIYPNKKSIWWKLINFEKKYGNKYELDDYLKNALKHCPKAIRLWLFSAKEKLLDKDVNKARLILAEAFRENGNSEDIWIEAFNLEFQTNEYERAKKLLKKARSQPISSTPRILLKNAVLERRMNNTKAQKEILLNGVDQYPTYWKLWIMLAQLEEKQGNFDDSRQVFISGLRVCISAIPLWINYALLEEKMGHFSKARALLEQGILKNPKNETLWLAAIKTELRAENKKNAEFLLVKAIQKCPKSGLLWSMAIEMAPHFQRKAKCSEALKICDNAPYVICAIAKLFWDDRKINRARNWLMRDVAISPKIGDFWGYLYCLELKYGTHEKQDEVIKKCKIAEPKYGDKWCKISKDPEQPTLTIEQILIKVATEIENENLKKKCKKN